MIGKYELKLYTDTGTLLETLPDFISLEYSILTGDIGVCSLVMPHTWATTNIFTAGAVNKDYKIAVYRTAPGGSQQLENVYLLRGVELYDNERGRFTKLIGVDGNQLLSRRIVYLSGFSDGVASAWTTEHADRVMKYLVKYHLLNDGDNIGDRAMNDTYFAVDADSTSGPHITDEFAWRNVLESVQSLAKMAVAAGTPVYWRVVPVSMAQYKFYTYVGQIGTDRTASVTASVDDNNMRNPHWTYDAVEEKNRLWILGTNANSAYNAMDRNKTSVHSSPSPESAYDVEIEAAVDFFGGDDVTANMKAFGKPKLRDMNPKRTFSFELADNATFRYGVNWFFGDKIAWEYRDLSGNAIVKSVVVRVEAGQEVVNSGLDIMLTNSPA